MFACGGTGYLCPSLLVAGTCSALLVSSSPAVRGKSQARGRSLAVEIALLAAIIEMCGPHPRPMRLGVTCS